MVDKLLKIGNWLWNAKERMVLAAMFCILCYRAYQVFYPPPPPQEKRLDFPRKSLEDVDPSFIPPQPRSRIPSDLPGAYAGLYNRNPFWYHARAQSGQQQKEITPKDLGLSLHAIRQVGGRLRAQLSTMSVKRRWYDEGEKFEEYELQEIDPENNTVVVYAERYARRFTLSIE